MGVDQRGVHLLEARTRNVLTSYEYDTVIDYTPTINHLLLITGMNTQGGRGHWVVYHTSPQNNISYSLSHQLWGLLLNFKFIKLSV